jgi:hypothetical protein
MLKIVTKIDMLRDAQNCIDSIPEFKGHVKLDLLEDDESGADLSFKVITDLPVSWNLREKVVSILYDCLEKYDPYIMLNFDWESLAEGRVSDW